MLLFITIFSIPFLRLGFCFPRFMFDLPALEIPVWCNNGSLADYKISASGHAGCGFHKYVVSTARFVILNPFGKDFQTHYHESNVNETWQAICELDSDDDGRSNGEEMGDPKCTWNKSKGRRKAVSHPGYAEHRTGEGTYLIDKKQQKTLCKGHVNHSKNQTCMQFF